MSQNMPDSSMIRGDVQSLIQTENDPLASVATLKIVACPICRAVYIPSSRQSTATLASLTLLETAFLAVCHFCFRCQRPACPQCWNSTHQLCSCCCEEAHLSPRLSTPCFEGLIFSPQVASQAVSLSFACLHNGRFYAPEPAPGVESLESRVANLPSTAHPVSSATLPVFAADPELAPSTYPSWLQEVMGLPANEISAGQRQNTSAIHQVPSAPTVPFARADGSDWLPMAQTLSPMSPLPDPRVEGQERAGVVQEEFQDEEALSLFERIENVLIIAISALLLTIILMIVLALSSAAMNTFFFHLLHIDIRAEILYLLQLR